MPDESLDYITTGVNGVEYYVYVGKCSQTAAVKFTVWVYVDTEWRYSISYYVDDVDLYNHKVSRLYKALSDEYDDVRIVKNVKA